MTIWDATGRVALHVINPTILELTAMTKLLLSRPSDDLFRLGAKLEHITASYETNADVFFQTIFLLNQNRHGLSIAFVLQAIYEFEDTIYYSNSNRPLRFFRL